MKKLLFLIALFAFFSMPSFAQAKRHHGKYKHYKGKTYHRHYRRGATVVLPPGPPLPPRGVLPPLPPPPPRP